jgi:hypothetical protein
MQGPQRYECQQLLACCDGFRRLVVLAGCPESVTWASAGHELTVGCAKSLAGEIASGASSRCTRKCASFDGWNCRLWCTHCSLFTASSKKRLSTGRSAMQVLPAHAACMRFEQHSHAICPTHNRCSSPLVNLRGNAAVPAVRQHDFATRRSRKQRRNCSTQGQAATGCFVLEIFSVRPLRTVGCPSHLTCCA